MLIIKIRHLFVFLAIFLLLIFLFILLTDKENKTKNNSQNCDVWLGEYNLNFKGEGSQYNPYIIASANDLAGMSVLINSNDNYKNKYWKLIIDLDLNSLDWNSIGNKNAFCGSFDGNGHTIQNLHTSSLNGGLFGVVGEKDFDFTEIKNLNLTNALINSNSSYGVGALCSTVNGQVEIENITINNSDINSLNTSCNFVGGLIGGVEKDCTNFVIDNIAVENCRINSFNSVGAVIGANVSCSTNATKSTISNCHISKNKLSYTKYAGGIVGFVDNIVTNNFIESCIVINNVFKYNESDIDNYVGSIVGSSQGKVIYRYLSVVNNTFQAQNAGGLIGEIANGQVYNSYSFDNVGVNKGLFACVNNNVEINSLYYNNCSYAYDNLILDKIDNIVNYSENANSLTKLLNSYQGKYSSDEFYYYQPNTRELNGWPSLRGEVKYHYTNGKHQKSETQFIFFNREVDLDKISTNKGTFSGWSYKENDENVLDKIIMPNYNIDLYAVYLSTITIKLKNASSQLSVTGNVNEEGMAEITLPKIANFNNFTKLGWSWGTSANASIAYDVIDETTILISPSYANRTLYACYAQIKEFPIYYFDDVYKTRTAGAVCAYNYCNSYNFLQLSKPNVTLPILDAINGYKFMGWAESLDTFTATKSVVVNYTSTLKEYYAVYSKSIVVQFNANGGSNVPSSISYTNSVNSSSDNFIDCYMIKKKISNVVPNKTDCEFLGWAENKNASEAEYLNGQTYGFIDSVILYAVYKSNINYGNISVFIKSNCNNDTTNYDTTLGGVVSINKSTFDSGVEIKQSSSGTNEINIKINKGYSLSGLYIDTNYNECAYSYNDFSFDNVDTYTVRVDSTINDIILYAKIDINYLKFVYTFNCDAEVIMIIKNNELNYYQAIVLCENDYVCFLGLQSNHNYTISLYTSKETFINGERISSLTIYLDNQINNEFNIIINNKE